MKYALALALAMAAVSCTRQPPPAPAGGPAGGPAHARDTVPLEPAAQREAGVAVEEARYRSLPQLVRATARLANDENRTWRVGAITEGRVVAAFANPGDEVREGQVLARMHSHGIHEARAEYGKAATELARARNLAAFARSARDRARRLYDLKAASLEQLEHAETELRNAETGVVNGEYEVERTRHHLEDFLGIPATVPGGAPAVHGAEYEYIPVRSPAAGTVLTRNVTPGTVVTPANDLFVISDLSRLWAMAEVNEEYLPSLRTGMPVRIFVQAYGTRAFPGRIGKLGETLDPATRTVRVRVDLDNPGGRLKPEMYATAEIELGSSESAVFVPEEAIQEVRGQTVVFVRTGPALFELRVVETGSRLGGAVEIVRGLRAGDPVVARGAFILKSEFLKASLAEE